MAEEPEKRSDFPDEMASVFTAASERSRWPPLTRMLMSGEMSGEPPRDLTLKEKVDVWMVNEGYRRLFIVVFALLHLMIFAFAFLNFDLKDNLSGPRATFGTTYPIARSAALVLHFDVALLLLRMDSHTTLLCPADNLSGVPDTYLSCQADAVEWHYTIRWEIYFLPWLSDANKRQIRTSHSINW